MTSPKSNEDEFKDKAGTLEALGSPDAKALKLTVGFKRETGLSTSLAL
jgi:hypothetical protein